MLKRMQLKPVYITVSKYIKLARYRNLKRVNGGHHQLYCTYRYIRFTSIINSLETVRTNVRPGYLFPRTIETLRNQYYLYKLLLFIV